MRRHGMRLRLTRHVLERWRQHRPADRRADVERAVRAALHGRLTRTTGGAFTGLAGSMEVVLALDGCAWVAVTAYPAHERRWVG